jgi:hypothetical protein
MMQYVSAKHTANNHDKTNKKLHKLCYHENIMLSLFSIDTVDK